MLIVLTGPICAGKHAVAEFFTQQYQFTKIALDYSDSSSSTAVAGKSGLVFQSVTALITYVTSRWSESFVLMSLERPSDWDLIGKRPFALLVTVDAPVTVRFKRYSQKCSGGTLAEFLERDEQRLYAPNQVRIEPDSEAENNSQGGLVGHVGEILTNMTLLSNSPNSAPIESSLSSLYSLMSKADLRIVNHFSNLDDLHVALSSARLTDPDRLRPSWDSYFMELCNLAARRSNCMKRRVGAILVKERRIISTGYNGTPRGVRNCNEGGCPRCNENAPCGSGLDSCLCLHAEENALLEAGRERVDATTILYCNTCPCLGCAKKIVQVGVHEVVFSQSYGMDDMTAKLLKEGGVHLRQHIPIRNIVIGSDI
ncbi:cytidine deaminase-like protein [Phlyctochytrium arcticum]|nr:cytidine deaminase-like protein [Phlyctochytrium arcticum]